MIDHWHDLYHADEPDYINCPYCQDEFMAEGSQPADRLEDLEV